MRELWAVPQFDSHGSGSSGNAINTLGHNCVPNAFGLHPALAEVNEFLLLARKTKPPQGNGTVAAAPSPASPVAAAAAASTALRLF